MNKILLLSSCLLILFACGGGSEPTVTIVVEEPTPTLPDVVDYQLVDTATVLQEVDNRLQGLSLADFFRESFKIVEERNQEDILTSGRSGEFGLTSFQLNNVADDNYFQLVAIKDNILTKLLSYDRNALTTDVQLSYDVYKTYLEFEIEWADYRNFEYPATYGFFGLPGATESLFTEVLQISDENDAQIYLDLLNQVGRRFQQIEQLLTARETAGVIEPYLTLNYSLGNVIEIANAPITTISYYQSFADKLNSLTNIPETKKIELIEILNLTIKDRIKPAYLSLSQLMTTLVNKAPQTIGFGQFNGGKAFYDFSLRYFTSGELTADQIHALGLQELSRIHDEMKVLFQQLGYPANDSIEQSLARASTDGGTIAGDQAVAFYENIIAQTYTKLPQAFSTIPVQEVVVIGGESGGYYISGSEDGSRPGAFYASTTSDLPYFTMPTLTYHESIPGHHMQIALSKEIDLPRFRREMHFTSFIEGWGLYAERLAKDLGWYSNDPYGDIGRLQFEAMRASRLVIDTGIHNKGWSYEQAQAFSQTNIGNSGAIARYSVWPGQATAYMTGMLKILELRESAKNQLGAFYDIRDFHEVVIGNGSMPVNLLEQAVDNYIAQSMPVKSN